MKSLKDLEEDSRKFNIKVIKYVLPPFIVVLILLLLVFIFRNSISDIFSIIVIVLVTIMLVIGLGFLIYYAYKWFKLCAKIYKKRKEEKE